MKKKLSITVLCGGASTEHVISIKSATNVVKALDQSKYAISVIYITQQGAWYYTDKVSDYLTLGVEAMLSAKQLVPITLRLDTKRATFISLDGQKAFETDCIFPLLHGTHGEDGTVQGLLQLVGVPFVGDDALSSAMCMDKDITKQLLRAHGLATAPWTVLTKRNVSEILYEHLTHTLGEVLFVKPNSLGSSVGVSRVSTQQQFEQALEDGFRYDERLLVEPCIVGREVECAVLGNDEPVASLPAEIISTHTFYSYEAKYLDPRGAQAVVPAQLPEAMIEKIRKMAVEAFKILRCSGMLRVDFFLESEQTPLINEVNTIPGFTDISMYPKMWQASGLTYSTLLDQLILLALERNGQLQKLQRVYTEVGVQKQTGEGKRI